jgi:predicted ATPase
MKNIIAFSGTHGTGKSTQAYLLGSRMKTSGKNVVVIDELARECPLPINKEAGLETQYWIISSQIKREIELSEKYSYIIADRSLMDSLSYAYTLGLTRLDGHDSICNYMQMYYDTIFVLDPLSFDYHYSDGIRDMDVDFRMDVHENLLRLYNLYHIDYIYVKDRDFLEDYINIRF